MIVQYCWDNHFDDDDDDDGDYDDGCGDGDVIDHDDINNNNNKKKKKKNDIDDDDDDNDDNDAKNGNRLLLYQIMHLNTFKALCSVWRVTHVTGAVLSLRVPHRLATQLHQTLPVSVAQHAFQSDWHSGRSRHVSRA